LNYVKSYTAYSNTFIEFAKKVDLNHFGFTMHQFEPARVLKQIISMFISLNGWDFSKNHPELQEYVLDPDINKLPSRYRLFNYINTEGQLRNCRLAAIGNFTTSRVVVASEITFPPLGHVLTIDFFDKPQYLFDITKFHQYEVNDLVSVDFDVFRLPTHLPFPLDYREKSTIQEAIKQNSDFRTTSA
jgi:hypothetical protein